METMNINSVSVTFFLWNFLFVFVFTFHWSSQRPLCECVLLWSIRMRENIILIFFGPKISLTSGDSFIFTRAWTNEHVVTLFFIRMWIDSREITKALGKIHVHCARFTVRVKICDGQSFAALKCFRSSSLWLRNVELYQFPILNVFD